MSDRSDGMRPFSYSPREDAGYTQPPKPNVVERLVYVGRVNRCSGAFVRGHRVNCGAEAEHNTALCARCAEREREFAAERKAKSMSSIGTSNRRGAIE